MNWTSEKPSHRRFSDQDPVAEFLFDEFSQQIQNDRKIKGLISILPAHKEDLLFEIERKLQYDPWSKFIREHLHFRLK